MARLGAVDDGGHGAYIRCFGAPFTLDFTPEVSAAGSARRTRRSWRRFPAGRERPPGRSAARPRRPGASTAGTRRRRNWSRRIDCPACLFGRRHLLLQLLRREPAVEYIENADRPAPSCEARLVVREFAAVVLAQLQADQVQPDHRIRRCGVQSGAFLQFRLGLLESSQCEQRHAQPACASGASASSAMAWR